MLRTPRTLAIADRVALVTVILRERIWADTRTILTPQAVAGAGRIGERRFEVRGDAGQEDFPFVA
jgi:hypothetical protein